MLLVQKVIKDLYEAKLTIEGIILNTQSVNDYVSYKFLLGRLNGLDIAINLCKNALEELNNDKNPNGKL